MGNERRKVESELRAVLFWLEDATSKGALYLDELRSDDALAAGVAAQLGVERGILSQVLARHSTSRDLEKESADWVPLSLQASLSQDMLRRIVRFRSVGLALADRDIRWVRDLLGALTVAQLTSLRQLLMSPTGHAKSPRQQERGFASGSYKTEAIVRTSEVDRILAILHGDERWASVPVPTSVREILDRFHRALTKIEAEIDEKLLSDLNKTLGTFRRELFWLSPLSGRCSVADTEAVHKEIDDLRQRCDELYLRSCAQIDLKLAPISGPMRGRLQRGEYLFADFVRELTEHPSEFQDPIVESVLSLSGRRSVSLINKDKRFHPYEAAPFSVIIDLLRRREIAPDDLFCDVGSGLGKGESGGFLGNWGESAKCRIRRRTLSGGEKRSSRERFSE